MNAVLDMLTEFPLGHAVLLFIPVAIVLAALANAAVWTHSRFTSRGKAPARPAGRHRLDGPSAWDIVRRRDRRRGYRRVPRATL